MAQEMERREFKMHPKLLFDVIQRQAGSLEKAILEGVMNAADAGADYVEVRLDNNTLTIEDNGRGFQGKEEITKFFEVFGQPHEEEEGKVYGTFRMGRGQIMSYGRNIWQTDEWMMDVDIKNDGLDYTLQKNSRRVDGCEIHVDLYDRIYDWDIQRAKKTLSKWCKWSPVTRDEEGNERRMRVIFNDEVISQDPEGAKWDLETEDAYIKINKTGGVRVYNLGVYVTEIPGYRYGIGGEVVSKEQLKVNFARNDIQSDCEVFSGVKEILEEEGDKVTETEKLNSAGRERVADRIMSGQLERRKALKAKVITCVHGGHIQVSSFLGNQQYTVAPRLDKVGKAIHSRTFCVVAEETLDRFGVSDPAEFAQVLAEKVRYYKNPPSFTSFEIVKENTETYQNVLETKDLSRKERVWRNLARNAFRYLPSPSEKGIMPKVAIQVGESPHDLAWTDRKSYIALSKRFLKGIDFDIEGFTKLGMTLLHELCHYEHGGEGGHDFNFYETFHHLALDERSPEMSGLGMFIHNCITRAPTQLAKQDLKIPTKLRKIHELGDE